MNERICRFKFREGWRLKWSEKSTKADYIFCAVSSKGCSLLRNKTAVDNREKLIKGKQRWHLETRDKSFPPPKPHHLTQEGESLWVSFLFPKSYLILWRFILCVRTRDVDHIFHLNKEFKCTNLRTLGTLAGNNFQLVFFLVLLFTHEE